MSAEHNKAIALQVYEDFDRGNLEQAIVFLAPDFVAHIPGAPGLRILDDKIVKP